MTIIYEGKSKRLHTDPDSTERIIVEFTDAVTAGDGARRDLKPGKGKIACDTTEFIYSALASMGIETHLVKRLEGPRLLCHRVRIFPVEAVCRNVAAGSFCRRYGIERGRALSQPLVEFFLKNDALHDPLITAHAIADLGLASEEDVEFMRSVTLSVNYYLTEMFSQVDLKLVDFKLEFGKAADGRILLADEISGDGIRVWEKTGASLDKDLFREDRGDVVAAYRQLLQCIRKSDISKVPSQKERIRVIVMPRDGIKNPQGEVTKKALNRLGLKEADTVRSGRIYDITLDAPLTNSLLMKIKQMNAKLLSNPIAEKSQVRMET